MSPPTDPRRDDPLRRGDALRQGDADCDGHGDFDALDAARRFPSETEWLDLPAPPAGEISAEGKDRGGFADRVMGALRDERATDRELDALDRALPPEALAWFEAPAPGPTFVEDTMARLRRDRAQRVAETLSRYVSPEPAPAFVDRTMAALREEHGGRAAQPAASAPRRAVPRRAVPGWALVSAAAAALLWLTRTEPARAPLELRLADGRPTAASYAASFSPMAAIAARVAADEEPDAIFDQPADGLWLLGPEGAVR